jgi:hypothetical protein
MIIQYKISNTIPNSTLLEINLELYSYNCIFQIRHFGTHMIYIISDYFDYNKEHQKKFMEVIMKYASEHIISFHCR